MNDKKIRWISFLAIPTMLFFAMEIFYVLSNVEYARIVWIPGFVFCFIILTGIYYLVFGIVGNSYISTVVMSILLYVLLIVNQIKIALSDEPVFLSDILFLNSTGTFMGILKDSLWQLILRYAVLMILLLVAFVFICKCSKKYNYKILNIYQRGTYIIIPIAFFVTIFIPTKTISQPILTCFFNIEGRQDSYATTNMGYYFKFGFLSGVYGQFIESRLEEPKDYSAKNVIDTLENVDISDEDTGGFGKPNIIMIFSESFWNIDNVEEIKFDKQVASNYNELAKDGKLINMISPSYGGISANVEFEVLTSGSIKFFTKGYIPYMQLYNEDKYFKTPSVISELENNGYKTHIMSTWEESLFNCYKVYEYIGVDETEYNRTLKDADLKGDRISDDYVGKHIIEAFKNKDKNEKLFYMALTAQAHMPFNKDKYSSYDIDIVDSELSDSENDVIRSYAQGVYDADKQLKEVYEYIQTIDEPTLIIFYGDHLPYLKTESGKDISNKLKYFNTEDKLLDAYRKYNTECLILSNYLEKEDYETIDTNYLGTDLLMPYVLNKMDIEVSNYYKWLYKSRHTLPASNLYVTVDKEGNLYSTNKLQGEMKECFDLRNQINWRHFVEIE